MKRLLVMVAGIVCAACFLLSGCGKSAGSTAKKSVTIKVLDGYGGSGMVKQMLDLYQQENPNITIDYESVSSDSYYAKFTALNIADTLPDITWANANYFVEEVKSGLLVDLSNELTNGKNAEGDKKWGETFVPTALENCRNILRSLGDNYTGKNYGVPFTMTTVAVVYDKALFDSLGLKAPETWADFENVNAALKKAGYIPISMQEQNIDWWPRILWDQYCREKLTADPNAFEEEHMSFTDPQVKKGLTEFKKMYDKGWFPDSSLTARRDDMVQLFVQKKMPQVLIQSNYLDYLTKNVPAGVELASYALPGINGLPSRCLGGSSDIWAVTKRSRHIKEAIDVVKFITSRTAFAGDYAKFITPCLKMDATSQNSSLVMKGYREAGANGFIPEIFVPINITTEIQNTFRTDLIPNYLLGKYDINDICNELNVLYKENYLNNLKEKK